MNYLATFTLLVLMIYLKFKEQGIIQTNLSIFNLITNGIHFLNCL